MGKAEIDRKFDEIVEFADVARFLDTPVKHYSTGMHVRLAFAVAANLEPETLIVDEVLAVGDAAFQRKCIGKMQGVARAGRTVLFVTHNMPTLMNLCPQSILLEAGRVVCQGPTADVVSRYLATDQSNGAFKPRSGDRGRRSAGDDRGLRSAPESRPRAECRWSSSSPSHGPSRGDEAPGRRAGLRALHGDGDARAGGRLAHDGCRPSDILRGNDPGGRQDGRSSC